MTILSRQVDEWIVIGEKLTLSPTDIDAGGVRIIVRGELMGGPEDGLAVDRPHELAVGSSLPLGALVSVTLMKVEQGGNPRPSRAVFGIQAPPNVTIHRKELADPKRRRPPERGNDDDAPGADPPGDPPPPLV